MKDFEVTRGSEGIPSGTVFPSYDPKTMRVSVYGVDLCTKAEWDDYLKAFKETKEELERTKKLLSKNDKAMKEYNKIDALYKRDEVTKKVIPQYRNEEYQLLERASWDFTEKVDGTNIRIHWDGHNVEFGGRTDNAQIPVPLVNKLNELFGGPANEQLFEQKFGDANVILFGEGYGPKIQNGGQYRDDVSFILFDVQIGDWYLKRPDVEDIAKYFNIDVVPIVLEGTLLDAVEYIKGHPKSTIAKNGAFMEGVVGRPVVELRDRRGKRIIVKIKWEDIKELI